jgi:hypothetical protein
MCGGGKPKVPFIKPAFLTDFRIYWQVTNKERRGISQAVRNSYRAYHKEYTKQMKNSKTVTDLIATDTSSNGGHCEFYGLPFSQGIYKMIHKKFKVVLKDNRPLY